MYRAAMSYSPHLFTQVDLLMLKKKIGHCTHFTYNYLPFFLQDKNHVSETDVMPPLLMIILL